jgi:hypothetical protein
MTRATAAPRGPAFVVLRQLDDDTWQLIGEVPRRPGLPARKARARAIVDATGSEPAAGDRYAAVLRSEWRIALEY